MPKKLGWLLPGRVSVWCARFAWFPPALLLALALISGFLNPTVFFEPPWLLPPLNVVFLTAIPLAVASIALRAYTATGVTAVLAVGTGALAMGTGGGFLAVSLLYLRGPDAAVMMHNCGVLLAGLCHCSASLLGIATSRVRLPGPRARHIVAGYGGVLVAVALLFGARMLDLLPTFFVQNQGPTPLRQVVLAAAINLFALAALFWWQAYRRTGVAFLRWYAFGLALFAVGLFGVFWETSVASLLSWAGRGAQFLATPYLLIAVLEASRDARGAGVDPQRSLALALLQAGLPYRPLVESASDAVAALDGHGRVLYWNAAAQRLFGHAPEDAFDAEFLCLVVPPEQLPAVRAALQPGASGRTETVLEAAGGWRFPAELTFYPQPPLTVAVVRDITERKCAEAALRDANETLEARVAERTAALSTSNAELRAANKKLEELTVALEHELQERERAQAARRESEAHYQRVVQNTTAIILRVDPQGVIRFANERALEFFGYSKGELLGKHVVGTIVPERQADGRDLAAMVRDIRKDPDRFHSNANENMRKNGERVWLEWTNSGIYDADGHLTGFLSVGIDASDRKRAEEAVRQSEVRYRMLHETLRDAFVQVGMDGRIVDCNEVYCQMLGYTREELHALTYQELTPERWHAFEARIVRDQIIARGYSDVYEKEYRRKDGTIFPVELRTILARDASGRPSAMWGIVREIGERKRAEEALRRTLAEKEAALATNQTLLREVHHRVKNNLQMLCDLMYLQMEAMPDPGQHQDLQDAYGRIYAIARLHEQLYQSMQSGQVAVEEYLRRLAVGFESLFPQVSVKVDADGSAVCLDLDRAIHLGLIVNELITNAAKHAFPKGQTGEVTVRVRTGRDDMYLQVRDNGQGLPADLDLEHTKSIGLRTVYLLARRLEAQVSITRNGGTGFTLTFPLRADPPREPVPEQA